MTPSGLTTKNTKMPWSSDSPLLPSDGWCQANQPFLVLSAHCSPMRKCLCVNHMEQVGFAQSHCFSVHDMNNCSNMFVATFRSLSTWSSMSFFTVSSTNCAVTVQKVTMTLIAHLGCDLAHVGRPFAWKRLGKEQCRKTMATHACTLVFFNRFYPFM